MHPDINHNRVYRPDIDGLRAIAVLSVIIYHLNPNWLPGGFLGVDIFFVISGYLITGIIVRENVNGNFSFSHFYARRTRRIFPALFVVLIISALAAILLLTPETYVNFMKSSRYAAAQLSNFFFAREVSYFSEGFSGQALLHTWSLGVEEQFYLAWPLLIFLGFWHITRSASRNNDENKTHRSSRKTLGKVAILFIVLSLASFASGYYLAVADHKLAFYMFYTRAWEFAVGGLLVLNLFPAATTKRAGNLAGITGILLLGYSFIYVRQEYLGTSFLRFGIILPVLGSALIMYANQQVSLVNRKLAMKAPVAIGRISYSLYLYHWPIIIFFGIYTGRHDNGLAGTAVIVILTFILSILSYHMVEQPARRSAISDRRVLLYGFLAIIALAVTFKSLEKSAESSWRISSYTEDTGTVNQQPRRPDGCFPQIKNYTQLIYCNTAQNENAPVVALLGDSHGYRFVTSTVNWARENGYNVISLNVPGCPMLLGGVHIRSTLDPKHERMCANALPLLKSEILNNPDVKLVLLAQRFELFFDGRGFNSQARQITFVNTDGSMIRDHTAYYQQKLAYTVENLKQAGKQVVILKQIPLMANLKACNWKPLIYRIIDRRRNCNFDTEFISKWQLPAAKFIDRFISKHKLNALDLTPYIDGPIQNGENIYMDIDHLNERGSQFISPYFVKELNRIMDKANKTVPKNNSTQTFSD